LIDSIDRVDARNVEELARHLASLAIDAMDARSCWINIHSPWRCLLEHPMATRSYAQASKQASNPLA